LESIKAVHAALEREHRDLQTHVQTLDEKLGEQHTLMHGLKG
jgi:hypothetical protein